MLQEKWRQMLFLQEWTKSIFLSMDNTVHKIAQIIKEKGIASHNFGLINGNTGISIFFYHLARRTGNPEYEKIADELLDNVYLNISTSAPSDYENGLAGIGWGIEYLVQNNFAEGNTDEILEDVDNKVFRSLNEEVYSSFELTNGITGYLFYLIIRLKNLTFPISMAKRITRELLIQTINRIDELVTLQFPSIVKDVKFDLFWGFPAMLVGLNEAYKLKAYNEKIVCMIKQWLPYFEAYIPSLHINRLFLAVVLKRLNSEIAEERLEKQIRILLFATDFEILKTEIDFNLTNVRFGWPGVILLLNIASNKLEPDYPNYQLLERTYLEIIDKQREQFEYLHQNLHAVMFNQFGLFNGLSGIGLMELLLPEILTGYSSNNQ